MNQNNNVTILQDDHIIHSFPPLSREIELRNDNIFIAKLAGQISMLDPCEFIINRIRKKYNKMPNSTDVEAVKSFQSIVSKFDKSEAIKAYYVCS